MHLESTLVTVLNAYDVLPLPLGMGRFPDSLGALAKNVNYAMRPSNYFVPYYYKNLLDFMHK